MTYIKISFPENIASDDNSMSTGVSVETQLPESFLETANQLIDSGSVEERRQLFRDNPELLGAVMCKTVEIHLKETLGELLSETLANILKANVSTDKSSKNKENMH